MKNKPTVIEKEKEENKEEYWQSYDMVGEPVGKPMRAVNKKKDYYKPFLEPDEAVLARNIVFDSKGKVKKLGYKTFRGMISQLRKANINCRKFGTKLQFQIILPIKP